MDIFAYENTHFINRIVEELGNLTRRLSSAFCIPKHHRIPHDEVVSVHQMQGGNLMSCGAQSISRLEASVEGVQGKGIYCGHAVTARRLAHDDTQNSIPDVQCWINTPICDFDVMVWILVDNYLLDGVVVVPPRNLVCPRPVHRHLPARNDTPSQRDEELSASAR